MPLTQQKIKEYSWLPRSATYKGNQGDYVFFIINLQELFNIDINYPGIKSALNKAFMTSKKAVPIDTGITLRSYTSKVLDNTHIEYFFDPNKIIGKIRKGQKVKVNYSIYIADSAKNYNWLSILMHMFYTTLFSEVKKLYNKQEKQNKKDIQQNNIIVSKSTISLAYAALFMEAMNKEYTEMKKQKQELLKIQKQKEKLKQIAMKLKEKELLEKKRAREQFDMEEK